MPLCATPTVVIPFLVTYQKQSDPIINFYHPVLLPCFYKLPALAYPGSEAKCIWHSNVTELTLRKGINGLLFYALHIKSDLFYIVQYLHHHPFFSGNHIGNMTVIFPYLKYIGRIYFLVFILRIEGV